MSIFESTKALVVAGAGAGIALFSAGSVAGYFYAKKKLVAEYDERLQDEIQKTRAFYKRLNKADEFGTPEAAVKSAGLEAEAEAALASYRPTEEPLVSDATIAEAKAVLEEEGYRGKNVVAYNGVIVDPSSGETLGPVVDNEPTQMIQHVNVFDQPPGSDVDFEYADEVKARTKNRPYIVSKAEFEANDHQHEQVTLTYYAGDNIVSDPNDKPVTLVDTTIGWDNLRFGHRSGDDNVVYIRHEEYTLDMEIVRDQRKYGEVVGGFISGTGLR